MIAVRTGDLSRDSQGLGKALARGERFGLDSLYGPAEPGSGGEGGSHPGKIPPLARGASQAAASLGLLEQRSRAGMVWSGILRPGKPALLM